MSPSVEPFDEAKYKALMDGLNCNEIKYSKLFPNNTIFRLDSEFFSREAIAIDNKIKSMLCFYLKPQEVVSGPFGSSLKSESYLEKGDVPFVRIENIRGGFDINMDNIIYISNADNDRIKNSQLITNDIVLSKVGNSIGFFARVDESIKVCNISENNIGIKLSAYSEKEKHYILVYLNCLYAQKLVLRRTSGNAQPKLNVGDLCYIPIPKFTDNFYKTISECILSSKDLILKSRKVYHDAENTLSETMGLDCLNQITPNATTKSISVSFRACGRLDAEYYHPKYDVLFDILSKQKTLFLSGDKGLVSIKKSFEPGSEAYLEEGIPFIRVSDVDKYEISTPPIMLSKDIVPNIEDLYPKKDTILLSKDGSIGIAYKLEKDMEAVTSGALLHLTVKDSNVVLPNYLTLVLNSPIVQLQAERDCNGAIIQHWKPSDIEKVLIPILDMSVQREIASKVQESFRLRAESKRLLDLAVKAVEMAIESDEESALLWLESQK